MVGLQGDQPHTAAGIPKKIFQTNDFNHLFGGHGLGSTNHSCDGAPLAYRVQATESQKTQKIRPHLQSNCRDHRRQITNNSEEIRDGLTLDLTHSF